MVPTVLRDGQTKQISCQERLRDGSTFSCSSMGTDLFERLMLEGTFKIVRILTGESRESPLVDASPAVSITGSTRLKMFVKEILCYFHVLDSSGSNVRACLKISPFLR